MLAIVSDIHANLEAFEAVLIEIGKLRISRILCLGDVIGYGPNPVECLELAREFDLCLIGNHEEALVKGPHLFNRMAENAIHWTREQIDASPRAAELWQWIEQLPYYQQAEQGVLYVHGSPRDCATEYINARDVSDCPDKITDIFTFVERLCFVGHTHIPGMITPDLRFHHPRHQDVVDVSQVEKAIINTGSVGQPRDGDNRACFVTFDGRRVAWHRLPYRFDRTIEKISRVKMLASPLGQRLEAGR